MLIRTGLIWLWFGAGSLLFSGLLTSPMLLGKIVFLRDLLPGIEWIRWALVIHVIIATVIWHSAIPIGLIYLAARTKRISPVKTLEGLALLIVLAGIVLMFVAVPGEGAEPLLVNYIPVITQPVFYFALFVIFLGLTVGLTDGMMRFSQSDHSPELPAHVFHYRPLAMLGASFFLVGIVTLLFALIDAKSLVHLPDKEYFEFVMWGAGHFFQHSSAVFLICCWELLFYLTNRRVLLSSWQRRLVFLTMFWPIIYAPYLLQLPIHSLTYRESFTWLMRWGIFPGITLYIIICLARLVKLSRQDAARLIMNYPVLALAGSILLMIAGMLFGAFIGSSDLRVPGHYHASIGSVTVAFMALTARLLSGVVGQDSDPVKWMRAALLIYVPGQLMFSGGMFIAGWFGVARKTYGSGIEIESTGQMMGLIILGIGGVLAFLGGFCFALAMFSILCAGLRKSRVTHSHSD